MSLTVAQHETAHIHDAQNNGEDTATTSEKSSHFRSWRRHQHRLQLSHCTRTKSDSTNYSFHSNYAAVHNEFQQPQKTIRTNEAVDRFLWFTKSDAKNKNTRTNAYRQFQVDICRAENSIALFCFQIMKRTQLICWMLETEKRDTNVQRIISQLRTQCFDVKVKRELNHCAHNPVPCQRASHGIAAIHSTCASVYRSLRLCMNFSFSSFSIGIRVARIPRSAMVLYVAPDMCVMVRWLYMLGVQTNCVYKCYTTIDTKCDMRTIESMCDCIHDERFTHNTNVTE